MSMNTSPITFSPSYDEDVLDDMDMLSSPPTDDNNNNSLVDQNNNPIDSDLRLPLKKRRRSYVCRMISAIHQDDILIPNTLDSNYFHQSNKFHHHHHHHHVNISSLGGASAATTFETCSLDSGFSENEPIDLSINSHSSSSSSLSSSSSSSSVCSEDLIGHDFINRKMPLKASLSSPLSSSSSSSSTTRLVCPNCRKVYESNARYRAHIRRHESKQSGRYQCQVCFKNFVQRSSLRTHERIHTGEKPYHCQVCQESFGDFSTFTKHRRTHTGEKPYACPVCNRCFSQSGNMHRHLKVVHRPRPNLYRQWTAVTTAATEPTANNTTMR